MTANFFNPPSPGHPTTSGAAQRQGLLKRRRCPSLLMSRNGGNGACWASHGQGGAQVSGETGIAHSVCSISAGLLAGGSLPAPVALLESQNYPLSAGPAQGTLL